MLFCCFCRATCDPEGAGCFCRATCDPEGTGEGERDLEEEEEDEFPVEPEEEEEEEEDPLEELETEIVEEEEEVLVLARFFSWGGDFREARRFLGDWTKFHSVESIDSAPKSMLSASASGPSS